MKTFNENNHKKEEIQENKQKQAIKEGIRRFTINKDSIETEILSYEEFVEALTGMSYEEFNENFQHPTPNNE